MRKLAGRKFLVTVAALALVACSRWLGLDGTALAVIGTIVTAFVGGQSYVDGRSFGCGARNNTGDLGGKDS